MRYAVWFVRLVYAAWMIPAGLNHFIRLYPQPIGNQPLSIEVFTALLDSGLFTFVKAVELLAGVAVLLGFRLPLMLLMVLPVSFTVTLPIADSWAATLHCAPCQRKRADACWRAMPGMRVPATTCTTGEAQPLAVQMGKLSRNVASSHV